VTALDIRIRETRVDLPSADGARGHLVVTVPDEPLKLDRGTVIFPWRARDGARLIVKVYGEMGVFNWLRKQAVGYRARREFQALARLREVGVECCEPLFWGTGRSRVHGLFEAVATRESQARVRWRRWRRPSIPKRERCCWENSSNRSRRCIAPACSTAPSP
jgi:hypothetical protein